MSITYSYAKAKQHFDRVLARASSDGEVKIRKDDQLFIIKSESKSSSPLDVEGVDMNMTVKEIISCIHESRKS